MYISAIHKETLFYLDVQASYVCQQTSTVCQ